MESQDSSEGKKCDVEGADGFFADGTSASAKHVDVQGCCQICREGPETIAHCLVSYAVARSCWERLSVLDLQQVGVTFADWLSAVWDVADDERRQLIALICWAIWAARNDFVWRKKIPSAEGIVVSVHLYLDKWTNAQSNNLDSWKSFMIVDDGKEHWSEPPENKVKINVDAAIFKDRGCFSFACVARVTGSLLVEACCRVGVIQPELSEAIE